MTNSPLIKYTKLSPNCNKPRNHAIDTITIHCMAGDMSVESCGEWFAKTSAAASSNYGVGSDGRIGLYVEEKDRSWCSSNAANDNRAVTIEVASANASPYAVTDKALAALIELCADICKRNGINRLLWRGDKALAGQVDKQNMTVHRWFSSKSCPGDYLYGRHAYIADEVNKRLGAAGIAPTPTPPAAVVPYTVKITADALNIRGGAGTSFAVKGAVAKGGVYTIVEEADGAGATKWGKLKSGAGWISLDFVQRQGD